MKIFILICILLNVFSFDVLADDASLQALKSSIERLNQSLTALQTLVAKQSDEIEKLKKENISLRQAPSQSVAQDLPPKIGRTFAPEIGLIADIVGSASENDSSDEEGNDRFSAREVELILGHDVDPYSRLDTTFSFSDFEEASIEEVYASYWDLPLESKLRLGKFRQKIGKASSIHRDSLETVDEPLVVSNFFSPEGFKNAGIDISFFTPLSLDSFTQQLTFGVLEGGTGEEGGVLGETRRIPAFYGHLGNFYEVSDSANLELGATWLNGSQDEDAGREVTTVGIDATVDIFITPRNKFKIQSEVFLVDNEKTFDEEVKSQSNPWGYYVLADYRLSQRWGIGARYDWLKPLEVGIEDESSSQSALSGYLTFFQSEFARLRTQYQYQDLPDGTHDNRIFLQGTFAIGTHKHQLQ